MASKTVTQFRISHSQSFVQPASLPAEGTTGCIRVTALVKQAACVAGTSPGYRIKYTQLKSQLLSVTARKGRRRR
jgi:hypothetical protein